MLRAFWIFLAAAVISCVISPARRVARRPPGLAPSACLRTIGGTAGRRQCSEASRLSVAPSPPCSRSVLQQSRRRRRGRIARHLPARPGRRPHQAQTDGQARGIPRGRRGAAYFFWGRRERSSRPRRSCCCRSPGLPGSCTPSISSTTWMAWRPASARSRPSAAPSFLRPLERRHAASCSSPSRVRSSAFSRGTARRPGCSWAMAAACSSARSSLARH